MRPLGAPPRQAEGERQHVAGFDRRTGGESWRNQQRRRNPGESPLHRYCPSSSPPPISLSACKNSMSRSRGVYESFESKGQTFERDLEVCLPADADFLLSYNVDLPH